MPNIQTTRAVLFTSLLFPVFCSMAETTSTKAIKAGVSNWLASLETTDFNKNSISCHAVIIHENWALTTNDCVPKNQHRKEMIEGGYYRELIESQEKIELHFSTESKQKSVKVSEVWRPSTQHTSYPILLKLESTLTSPFPALSFKTNSWFKELKEPYPLWTVYYLKRLKHDSENAEGKSAKNNPEINLHSHPVRMMDQSKCDLFAIGLDWKICSIPDGSGQVLGSRFQRGAVLLDNDFAVTGLGYSLNQESTKIKMNYFIPLGLNPFIKFIKDNTGINNPRETKQTKKYSEL